ncbi:bis(5'-nucleosyl)-tetraphosphatase (symmetrical) YqeK [Fictibacillus aquaticus]|uniref:bis(5'-nucleosyl)-tetraphosphatase (symmetrical) n=1 Tax=Fictibacillus aquaticus TaxID=2021314 RepID=A0A235FB44_9BACL|nr:bis(5'-nucleosyl)-tetraphosphatase (symmetrical) YqeK [Fictibacillus aquaticus]OYD57985.1 phosphohydrolase [Fictibacillus aquaticus]
MDRNKALELVRPHLTEHRYIHTLGVEKAAVELAGKYGADIEKARIAAILHDYAKFRPKEEMQAIVRQSSLPDDLLLYGTELLHAPVGAMLLEKEAGIKDKEILSAVSYHTTGRDSMTLLEKVIFLADYIEPNRIFPGVDEVRELAETSLEKASLKALQNTILFLMKQNQLIYPFTILAYNGLLREIKGK